MSDGKDYEIFVQNLQQTLLDSDNLGNKKNIKVERNKIIKDNCGIDRQFDLYWEYELGGITYKTIIECKDYASRIVVEKIDALIGKIRDIPDLKPIIATKTGYQSGAETKARNNRIDLLIVRELSDNDWKDKDGNPSIREINIDYHFQFPAKITNFTPFIDQNWFEKNNQTNKAISHANDRIFIDDIENNEKYSLCDLQGKLATFSNGEYGDLTHTVKFNDAYLVSEGLRLKINGYKVDYTLYKPVIETQNVDCSKELLGFIEYINKDSTTAIFKNKIIKDMKKR